MHHRCQLTHSSSKQLLILRCQCNVPCFSSVSVVCLVSHTSPASLLQLSFGVLLRYSMNTSSSLLLRRHVFLTLVPNNVFIASSLPHSVTKDSAIVPTH